MTARESAARPHPALLWGLASLMTVTWGLNPLVGKIALRSFPPDLLVAVRTAMAAGTIWLVYLFSRRGGPAISRRDWPALLLLGVVAQVGNQFLFINGLGRTSVTHTAFIFSLTPLVVLALAAALGQERITPRKLAGMLVALAGVVTLASDDAGGEASVAGDLLLLAGCLLFSAYSVFGKEKRKLYGPVVMNLVAYSGGAIALQPIIWLLHGGFAWEAVTAESWTALAYMATVPAVFGYLIYSWALGHVPASRLAVLQYLQPPFAATLGAVFLDEPVTATLVAGGAVILFGVFLAERG